MVLVTRGGVGIGRPTADAFLVRRRQRHLTGRVLGPLQEFGSLIAVSSVSVLAARSGLGGPQRDRGRCLELRALPGLDWGTRGVHVNAVAAAFDRRRPRHSGDGEPRTCWPSSRTGSRSGGSVNRPTSPRRLFLASDAASYITGDILPVNDGTMANS